MEITVTAKTYDDAITEALIELQTTSDKLVVTVIEEGREGLLGVIGNKPWVIKARVRKEGEEPDAEPEVKKADASETASEEQPASGIPTPIVVSTMVEEVIVNNEDVTYITKEEQEAIIEQNAIEPSFVEPEKKEITPVSEEEAAELTAKAVDFLNGIFSVMGMDVDVKTAFDHTENELSVVLSGDDMGVLIGKRGQTLDSLQYLASLVVNRHHDGYIRVKLDTENYRERRQIKLEELARNIARKVAKSKRAVELEPMNPYERRIIHSTLQSDNYVTTISEGEEPYRHVVVMLKKGGKRH